MKIIRIIAISLIVLFEIGVLAAFTLDVFYAPVWLHWN